MIVTTTDDAAEQSAELDRMVADGEISAEIADRLRARLGLPARGAGQAPAAPSVATGVSAGQGAGQAEACLRCGAPGWPYCQSCADADTAGLDARRRARPSPRPPVVSVRAWAIEHGLAGERGRIPYSTIRAWRTANPDAPVPACEEAMLRYEAARAAPPEPPVAEQPTPPVEEPAAVPTCGCGARLSKRSREKGDGLCSACRAYRDAVAPPPPPVDVAPPVRRQRTAGYDPADRRRGQRDEHHLPRAYAEPPADVGHAGRRCPGCGTLLGRLTRYDRCGTCRDVADAQSLAAADDYRDDGVPSRLSGVELPKLPGEIVLSGGISADLTIHQVRRDEQGRVICSGCSQPYSRWHGCGCDPGEYGDDDVPLDPRWSTGSFLPAPLSAAS